jgi:DNA-binding beta-propeller fold protein YncE
VFYHGQKGEVYVADTGNSRILIFDKVGTPIARIRHLVDGKNPGEIRPGEPRQVAVNSHGDLFVVDSLAGYLDVLDYRGRTITRISPDELLKMPRGTVRCAAVTVDSSDHVYLGTGGDESTVLVLDRDLRLARRVGRKGEGQGAFQSITSIWVDSAGKIYVTDARNEPAVQVFSPDGKFQLGFGAHSSGPNNFSLPAGVVTDDLGNIYVLDTLRHWIGAFTSSGEFVTRLGGGLGDKPGDLTYPSGLAGDGKRSIFVIERAGARLQGFEITITPPG